MKKQYDFSEGVRGKFYHEHARLNLPIYLDDDVVDFVKDLAKRKRVDAQTAVNNILRSTKELLR